MVLKKKRLLNLDSEYYVSIEEALSRLKQLSTYEQAHVSLPEQRKNNRRIIGKTKYACKASYFLVEKRSYVFADK